MVQLKYQLHFFILYIGLSAKPSHYPLLSMILREWQY